jgi:hypothetical protein
MRPAQNRCNGKGSAIGALFDPTVSPLSLTAIDASASTAASQLHRGEVDARLHGGLCLPWWLGK